jgi:hypothetical protein
LRRSLLLLALAGCATEDETEFDLRVVLRPATVTTTIGDVPVSQSTSTTTDTRWDLFGVRTRGCATDGVPPSSPSPWTSGVDDSVALTCAPDTETGRCPDGTIRRLCCSAIALPADAWCELDLVTDVYATVGAEAAPAGSMEIGLTMPDEDGTLDAWLQVPRLTVSTPESFRTTVVETRRINGRRQTIESTIPVLVELGTEDWLTPVAARLGAGEAVEVRPGDAEHDELVSHLVAGAALYLDNDDSGALSDEEREAGPVGVFAELP